MPKARRRGFDIAWGDDGMPEVDVLGEETRGPICWRHVRLQRVVARRPDRSGAECRTQRSAWIGTPLDLDELGSILPPHIVEALRRRQGSAEPVSIPPEVAPSALVGAAKIRPEPNPEECGGYASALRVALAMAERVSVTAVPQAGVLVRWEDSPVAELPSEVLKTLLAEAGVDPLGPVGALRQMARQLREAVTASLPEANREADAVARLSAHHPLRRLEEIEKALAHVSQELEAFVHRWYEEGLPAVLPAEFREPPTGNPLDVRLPPLPRLAFLWPLTVAAVELAELWSRWQLVEDAMRGAVLRAAGREGGRRRRRRGWDRADIEAVAAGLKAGMRLKEACAARLRALNDRTRSPDRLARAYRRACEKDPRLPRPRSADSADPRPGAGNRRPAPAASSAKKRPPAPHPLPA